MNIAFIPARCGSKSIKLKNIKEFCGKPLIYWSLIALQKAKCIDKIYVATDCVEIENVVNNFKLSKVDVFIRNKKNAEDESSTEDVMLEFLKSNNFQSSDLFFLVQATSPLTQSHDIENAYSKFIESKKDSLLTVVNEKRFFWNNKGQAINYDYKNRPRRQDFEGFFVENGAFYINSIKNILETKNRLSGNIEIFEMKDYTSIEIDEPIDWLIAENYMKEYILSKSLINSKEIKVFLSDVDGTLTDAGMYYDLNGNELKKFNTHDGKGFELLRKKGVKIGLLTSENTEIVKNRAKKLKVDYLYQGIEHNEKLEIAKQICKIENITLDEIAYIGDDVNCKELLSNIKHAACPSNSIEEIKLIPNIINLSRRGGEGAVREFIDIILKGR
ncbi:MAG: acylneuraminate cytidylyltransferase [Campylobacterales bacterium]|nr:acylneuraminate cytidylyltransferase [Campylobacterales bacterium]